MPKQVLRPRSPMFQPRTTVEARLAAAEMLVEIEAIAFVGPTEVGA